MLRMRSLFVMMFQFRQQHEPILKTKKPKEHEHDNNNNNDNDNDNDNDDNKQPTIERRKCGCLVQR